MLSILFILMIRDQIVDNSNSIKTKSDLSGTELECRSNIQSKKL